MEKIKISRSFLSGDINTINKKKGILRYNKMVDEYNNKMLTIKSDEDYKLKISSGELKKPELRKNKRGIIF